MGGAGGMGLTRSQRRAVVGSGVRADGGVDVAGTAAPDGGVWIADSQANPERTVARLDPATGAVPDELRRIGTPTVSNIVRPFLASMSAMSCGVVTITAPVTGTFCASVSWMSPVPGGRSTTR